MELHESGEMYLETILLLKKHFGYVRSIDIARELGYSKPSVSRAVALLKENDYICLDPNGMILLTDKGREIAENIYDRHTNLSKFLISIGVSEKTAQEDACRIEHVVSDETMAAIKKQFRQDETEEN
jgi:Mn-dependent DtxR family transcriptional regulator